MKKILISIAFVLTIATPVVGVLPNGFGATNPEPVDCTKTVESDGINTDGHSYLNFNEYHITRDNQYLLIQQDEDKGEFAASVFIQKISQACSVAASLAFEGTHVQTLAFDRTYNNNGVVQSNVVDVGGAAIRHTVRLSSVIVGDKVTIFPLDYRDGIEFLNGYVARNLTAIHPSIVSITGWDMYALEDDLKSAFFSNSLKKVFQISHANGTAAGQFDWQYVYTGTLTSIFYDTERNQLLLNHDIGASNEIVFLNATDGTFKGKISLNCDHGTGGGCQKIPKISNLNSSRAWAFENEANGVIFAELDLLNIADLGNTGTAVHPTNSSNDMHVNDFQLDGADNILVCGSEDDSNPEWFFAGKFLTSNATFEWGNYHQIVPSSNNNKGTLQGCALDFEGGYFQHGRYQKFSPGEIASFVVYESGGNFSLPFFRNTAVLTIPEPDIEIPPGDAGGAIRNLGASLFGESVASLFLWGFIFMAIIIILYAAMMKKVGVGDEPIKIGAIFVGTGAIIMNVFLEIWPVWVAIVLIILTASIILTLTGKLQGIVSRDRDG